MFSWFNSLWRRNSPALSAVQAHLTFGATSAGKTFSRTRLLLKKQLWIWPIIAVLLLALGGYGIRVAIERTMQENLRSQLQTLLTVERSMLETWMKIQESNATSLANDAQVRETASKLLNAGAVGPGAPEPTATAANQALLANELGPGMSAHNFVSFILVDKEQRIVASPNAELVGKTIPEYEGFLGPALEGHVMVSPPFASVVLLKDERGRMRTGVPTMFVAAPVRDANFQVVGVLAMRIRPEREFTRILHLGQFGQSGETYAIDKNGLLVSSSRFDESLILLGLLPDLDGAQSILTVSARDPGGNLAAGYRPKVRRAELPLTKAAAAVSEKDKNSESGADLAGYNDYRGVPVVGVWQWLPKYNIGLITEVDYAEAYRPLSILRWAFFSMLGLLVLSSVAIFVFTVVVARLQREAQKAVIEAKHLGQYRLEERIGAGAMGVVYKGHHSMLRRPTAIKLLNVEKVNEASIERFEREVQITCQLNHPNTVAIYDYGRTPEGVFYYAMEFLDGIDLQALVDKYGPQPEGRVISILKQICGSLYEAHSLGLVHRDIKPANVMINRRGSSPDVVKVLDFGLVRALDEGKQAQAGGGMTGTPLYMAPESIQAPDTVDPRSDLYAVGAIGYFLVTGKTVFHAETLVELCQRHITALPDSPSQRLGRPISAELESALLACLEKSRTKRPQTARDLAKLLDRAPTASEWTIDDADAWWGRHERGQQQGASAGSEARSETSAAGGIATTLAKDEPRSPENGSGTATSTSPFDRTIAH